MSAAINITDRGLLPAMTLPAAAAGSVTVTVAAVDTGGETFIMMPTEITIDPDTAVAYGYSNAGPGTMVGGVDHGVPAGAVTALDALIAAHEELYGVGFTPGTYLSSGSSYMTKMFGISGLFVFTVNDTAPIGAMSDGFAINECVLQDGDFIVFAYPEDQSFGMEGSSYFTQRSLTVEAGQSFELTLMGFDFMETLYGNPGSPTVPLTIAPVNAGAEIQKIDPATGILSPLGIYTDAAGKATLSFSDPGTYYISATGEFDNGYWDATVSLPYCEVTVTPPAGAFPVTLTYAAATGINIYDAPNATVPVKSTTTGTAVYLPAGVYWAEGVDAGGSMGRTRIEVTGAYAMTLFTQHFRVSNDSGSWVLGTDFTMDAIDFVRNAFIPGDIVNGNVMRYTVKNGDTMYARVGIGKRPIWGWQPSRFGR